MSATADAVGSREEALADRALASIKAALAGAPNDFEALIQEYADTPAVIGVVAAVAVTALLDVVSKQGTKLKALEARPKGLQYLGVWTRGTDYSPGDVITDHGAMWTCKTATTDRPGDLRLGGETHWQLAVKSGRDGRDGKDIR